MSAHLTAQHTVTPALREPALVRVVLIGVALVFLVLFVLVPLAAVFSQALEKGPAAYLRAVLQPEALAMTGLGQAQQWPERTFQLLPKPDRFES